MEKQYLDLFNVFSEKIQTWINSFIEKTPNIVLAMIIFISGIYISRFFQKGIVKLLEKRNIKASARMMIGNISSIFITVIFFMTALNVLNLDNVLKTILAGAGVAGLAIGLALQGTLSNTFSGIYLSFTKDLKIGDQIETTGYTGVIQDINLRKIKLKTADGNYVSIPNKTIIDNPLKNYSESNTAIIVVPCGVGYESDLDRVKNLTVSTVENMMKEKGKDSKVSFVYTEFADSSTNFEARFTIPSVSIMEMLVYKSDAIMAIKKTFDQESINIPFPIRTIEMPQNG